MKYSSILLPTTKFDQNQRGKGKRNLVAYLLQEKNKSDARSTTRSNKQRMQHNQRTDWSGARYQSRFHTGLTGLGRQSTAAQSTFHEGNSLGSAAGFRDQRQTGHYT
jgi:hypothetical protein